MLYFELPQARVLIDACADFFFDRLNISDEHIKKAMLHQVQEEIDCLLAFKSEIKKGA
jgi:hypothetical protein